MNKQMKEVVNQSIDYIIEHLNADISVKSVANHFHYSEFYFSRVFKAETGESVYAFIKRLKMDQSAIDMKLKKGKTITEIGQDYGYSSSNFSSAFSKHHRVSPAQFRKSTNRGSVENPFHPENIHIYETYDDYAAKVRIKEIKDMLVIYKRIIGDYSKIKEEWIRLMETHGDYFTDDSLMIERFYDDPSIASLESSICDLCITVDKDCKLENTTTIKGGKFAVYRYEGKISDIFSALQGIFSVWLPGSDYEMDERYGLNIYRAVDITNEYIVMDLCIPIK